MNYVTFPPRFPRFSPSESGLDRQSSMKLPNPDSCSPFRESNQAESSPLPLALYDNGIVIILAVEQSATTNLFLSTYFFFACCMYWSEKENLHCYIGNQFEKNNAHQTLGNGKVARLGQS